MKKRSEVDEQYTWKLEDMIPTEEAWEKLFQETSREIQKYDMFKGKLGESARTLYDALKFDDKTSLKIERLYVYARMRSDQDTARQKYQDMFGRAQSLSFGAAEQSSYLVPEILAIPKEVLQRYMESDSGMAEFKRLMEIILNKRDHTLSAEMEELLARSYEATQGASQIFTMFNNADVKFPAITGEHGQEIRITHANYISLMEHKDRRIRKDAFMALYGVYHQFQNTLAAAFSSNVKQSVFYSRARGYASSRQHSMAENEVPELVYDNLLAAVKKNLPLLHRYVKIRREALGLDEIHMYDLYTPMVTPPHMPFAEGTVSGANRTYTFEEAKSMVEEGLAPLGEEYLGILRQGFENRWIDVYENEGKRSGAYSWGAYGSHPYVLLNFDGTLNSVFTLAHEMGHAIHSYYSDASQPFMYAGYKIFVAEVASTCNEALLIRHLLGKTQDVQEKQYLINHFLESFRGTLFRQTMFAQFESMAHQKAQAGETLTAQALGEMYHQLNTDYFGPEMVADPEIDHEWERIPHFYTPFYVYQYATGFSAAVAISSRIINGDKNALDGYKKFLRGGCSLPPVSLLKLCGVDMSTTGPVEEALKVFGELLDEFCRLQ